MRCDERPWFTLYKMKVVISKYVPGYEKMVVGVMNVKGETYSFVECESPNNMNSKSSF